MLLIAFALVKFQPKLQQSKFDYKKFPISILLVLKVRYDFNLRGIFDCMAADLHKSLT